MLVVYSRVDVGLNEEEGSAGETWGWWITFFLWIQSTYSYINIFNGEKGVFDDSMYIYTKRTLQILYL